MKASKFNKRSIGINLSLNYNSDWFHWIRWEKKNESDRHIYGPGRWGRDKRQSRKKRRKRENWSWCLSGCVSVVKLKQLQINISLFYRNIFLNIYCLWRVGWYFLIISPKHPVDACSSYACVVLCGEWCDPISRSNELLLPLWNGRIEALRSLVMSC